MKQYITQATESRIKVLLKADIEEGKLLNYALEEIKSKYGWYGASVKEAKRCGVQFYAEDQIKVHPFYERILNGWSVKYNDFTYYTNTHGLNCWTIKDFNALVSAVYAENVWRAA